MLGTRGSGPHLGIQPVSKASPRVRITERPVESFLLLTSKSLPRLNNIRWDFRPPREDKPRQKADDSIFHFSTSCAAILEREPTQPGGGASSELKGQEGEGGERGCPKRNQEGKDLGKETPMERSCSGAKMDATQPQEKKNREVTNSTKEFGKTSGFRNTSIVLHRSQSSRFRKA